MNIFVKSLIIFLAITGAVSIMVGASPVVFGTIDFWQNHGVFFLIFITLFPRLTLIFSSVPFGGFFWWLGLIFAPRFLVAILATTAYWQTNPVLVVISWLVALSGETAEKYGMNRTVSFQVGGFRPNQFRWQKASTQQQSRGDQTIDAEFRRMDD